MPWLTESDRLCDEFSGRVRRATALVSLAAHRELDPEEALDEARGALADALLLLTRLERRLGR